MDYQNRVGSKKGSGGLASAEDTDKHRKERLRQLLRSNINIESDPYVVRTRTGQYDCKLCLTTHVNESSYISHTQGKRHQLSLMRREAEVSKNENRTDGGNIGNGMGISSIPKRKYVKIGKPGYKVKKTRDADEHLGLSLEIAMKEFNRVKPMYTIMSKMETTTTPVKGQCIVISGEPYENIGFDIPVELDGFNLGETWDYWDQDSKLYYVQLTYDRTS
ncbi:SF3a splicing factor complex subunit [Komagataella phaffii CBS 7435]|uniref:U1-type domain-containing protein n=2 Tax=Komagataella phaffii TaxID=460519 RepID=C4QVN0_KOMPG|nr:Hypothetical protein PAS_chr1-3_0241 [Komagataella phaffii GS115]AOA60513.1 GQ67_02504T0 [Komagataella phaffii]CAH2445961.1 SF3a splicing factor complex subunit [Komagataella phaffii CBS 7435]AOA66713.1 GQ68_02743T0 [Komagataella phaffii GS115]CAY67303.1 Hypothetical protein PAS_chr1-3_0241 [Komagataella phaffii GS115]CCA36408.1 SF3a splicing factor complex subunit [Komagataella phaffii CBS 7435]